MNNESMLLKRTLHSSSLRSYERDYSNTRSYMVITFTVVLKWQTRRKYEAIIIKETEERMNKQRM